MSLQEVQRELSKRLDPLQGMVDIAVQSVVYDVLQSSSEYPYHRVYLVVSLDARTLSSPNDLGRLHGVIVRSVYACNFRISAVYVDFALKHD